MKHKLNELLIDKLFEPPSKYNQRNKECTRELRHCYEQYSGEYISSPDFMQQLIGMGFRARARARVRVRATVIQQQRQG